MRSERNSLEYSPNNIFRELEDSVLENMNENKAGKNMTQKTSSKELEALIVQAMKKINAGKENDICRYIPVSTGGYIHHFTMRKMKNEDPTTLAKWVKKYIVDVPSPKNVTPKKRAARGSRKRRDQFVFNKNDIERLLNMARLAGDKEMIRKLTPRKDLRTIKRELISSIRHGRVEQELWDSYAEVMTLLNQAQNAEAEAASSA